MPGFVWARAGGQQQRRGVGRVRGREVSTCSYSYSGGVSKCGVGVYLGSCVVVCVSVFCFVLAVLVVF